MVKNHQFTIGWISPLPLEKEAARLVFDEEYPQEEVQHRNTFYLGGRIGVHKVVLSVQRRMGLSQAAILAEKMHAGFPHIKYFFLVGIAGGLPTTDRLVQPPRLCWETWLSALRGATTAEYCSMTRALGRARDASTFADTNGVLGDLLAAINNFRAEGGRVTDRRSATGQSPVLSSV